MRQSGRLHSWMLAASTAALVLPVSAAHAFPDGPVTIVVPFAAGGTSDLSTRALAEGLADIWGQPVVIENRPGGGTIVGLSAVVQSAPDGHTLASISGSYTVNPAVRSQMPFAFDDLIGIATFVESPTAIAAYPGLPADNLPELIELARERGTGDPIGFATPGLASSGHMSGTLLQQMGDFPLQHVPYSGSTQAFPDVLSGRVPLIFTTWTDIKPHYEAGTLKVIALLGVNTLDDAPGIALAGDAVPGFSARAFNGIAAPAGTPQEVLEQISEAIMQVVETERFRSTVVGLGSMPWKSTLAETQDFLRGEVERWTVIAQEAGIRLD